MTTIKIKPIDIVDYFYFKKLRKRKTHPYLLDCVLKKPNLNADIEIFNNVPTPFVEMFFEFKEDFILKIKKRKYLISSKNYYGIWKINENVLFLGKKPNFEFWIIGKNQKNIINFYINFFVETKKDNKKIKEILDITIETIKTSKVIEKKTIKKQMSTTLA